MFGRAFAQQSRKVWRIGFFYAGSQKSAVATGRYPAFLDGMRELGYVEGKQFIVDQRFAPEGNFDSLSSVAANLVKSKPDVIVTSGGAAALALKHATQTIPVVLALSNDPVAEGFAASLAHPGGNITGLGSLLDEMFQKHVELLKLALPKLSHVTVLSHARNPYHPTLLKMVDAAAAVRNIKALPLRVTVLEEIDLGFAAAAKEAAGAVLVLGDAYFVQYSAQIAAFAIREKLASTYPGREYPEAGGLMSYGPDLSDNYRRAASYVDKILKGARPGDLPIEQPTRFYLTINLRTAKAIGLNFPKSQLLRADKVIE